MKFQELSRRKAVKIRADVRLADAVDVAFLAKTLVKPLDDAAVRVPRFEEVFWLFTRKCG